jgi:DNA-binding NtrC family response regulator
MSHVITDTETTDPNSSASSIAKPIAALLVTSGDTATLLTTLVRELGYDTRPAREAAKLDPRDPVSLFLIDLAANGEALKATRDIRSRHPQAVVIAIADPLRPGAAADAIRAGVFDVLPQPPTARDLRAVIANAREQIALARAATAEREAAPEALGLVAISPAMRQVLEVVRRAAPGRCGIVIAGERGAGHKLIARTVHAQSPQNEAPFIAIDCAAPIDDDIESELFGPERSLERIGSASRLAEARSGTLFLENVLELPTRAQTRLVRILRDREVILGSEAERAPEPFDVRVIASVEGPLEAALEEGRLRPDLYERLSLIRLDLPALRQRRDDIPVLAAQFVKDLCRSHHMPIKTLTRPALTLLQALPWRGNAPELRGLLERLVLLVPHGLIRLEDVLAHTQIESSVSPTGFDATLRQARAKFERDYIAAVLQHQHGRIAEAARVLGIQRTNLYRKMRRLSLLRPAKGTGRKR